MSPIRVSCRVRRYDEGTPPTSMARPTGIATVHAAVVTAALALTVSAANGQRAARTEPRAVPAVTAVVPAFDTYPLVAIGEAHRNEQVHDFIAALVGDVGFLPKGGDIVVEFGNARYQNRMDSYIAGGKLDRKTLAPAWRDTVNILVWDAPVYERFFATVRDVNRTRQPATQLRVVLADPAIDWSTVRDRADWEQIVALRDRHFADVIEREVLTRGRPALLIFGSGHVENEKAFDRYGKPARVRSANLAELLEAEHPGATFRVTADWMSPALDARLASWRPPALVLLKGTWLGAVHVGPPSQTPTLENIADAFLYLGPTSSLTTSTPSADVYADTTYLRELLRRDAIQGGANAAELRQLSARFLEGRRH